MRKARSELASRSKHYLVGLVLLTSFLGLIGAQMAAAQSASLGAQETATATKAPQAPDSTVVSTGYSSYTLDTGDKIRVRIYQRDDLSGEFRIGTEGTISIPLLGMFKIAGLDEEKVRIAVSSAAKKIMEREVDVVVDVTERRPIYIVGYVEHPGVYPFALNMTVVHALSMAGGPFRPTFGGPAGELRKELGQIEQDTATLKRGIVRLARLKAEREDRPFAEAPPELIDAVGEAEARDLVEREKRLQASESEARSFQLEASKRSRDLAKQELDELRQKIAQIDNQINLNQTQKTALRTLISKGFTKTIQVAALDSNDATLALTKLEQLANISRATRTLEDLNSEAAAKEFARQRDLDAEMNTLTNQIDALKKSLATSREMVGLSDSQDSSRLGVDPDSLLTFSIMRRVAKGYEHMKVTDVTPLLPGDVLRIMLPIKTSAQVAVH